MTERNSGAEEVQKPSRSAQLQSAVAGSPYFRTLLYALLLLVLAVLINSTTNAYYGYLDRLALQENIAQQQAAIDGAQKIRRQTDNLVIKTQQLAGQGNQNAASILEQLRASGVKLKAREG